MFLENERVFRIPENSILTHTTGGFARRVLVLAADEPNHPGNLPFLTKILAAAQINLEKDTLFTTIQAGEPVSILPVLKMKQPEMVLVFGVPLPDLGITAELPFYQPQVFYGATFLIADALSVLEPDKVRKGKLWQALQQLFL